MTAHTLPSPRAVPAPRGSGRTGPIAVLTLWLVAFAVQPAQAGGADTP